MCRVVVDGCQLGLVGLQRQHLGLVASLQMQGAGPRAGPQGRAPLRRSRSPAFAASCGLHRSPGQEMSEDSGTRFEVTM